MAMMGGVPIALCFGRVDLSVSRSGVVTCAPGALRGRWVRLHAASVCTLPVYTLRLAALRWLD